MKISIPCEAQGEGAMLEDSLRSPVLLRPRVEKSGPFLNSFICNKTMKQLRNESTHFGWYLLYNQVWKWRKMINFLRLGYVPNWVHYQMDHPTQCELHVSHLLGTQFPFHAPSQLQKYPLAHLAPNHHQNPVIT